MATARHNHASPPGILNSLKQFLLTGFLAGVCMETCCCAECRVVIVHRMTYFVVCVERKYFDVVGSLATTDSQNGPHVYETLVHLHSVSVCCVDCGVVYYTSNKANNNNNNKNGKWQDTNNKLPSYKYPAFEWTYAVGLTHNWLRQM